MTDPEDRATPLPVYVLIGGGSQRFGRDKASYEVDGEPWALHVGRRLAAEDDDITLVGSDPTGGQLAGLPLVADAPGLEGPVAGAVAALRDRRARLGEGLLVLACCDLVRPERAWLRPLVDRLESTSSPSAAAYRTGDRWQPFPAVLHASSLERLGEGDAIHSLQALLTCLEAIPVAWPGDSAGPAQANRPDDLAALLGSSGGL